jgi:MoCo/4Fe-4S cofactor protein with predicted Tat translocation signal
MSTTDLKNIHRRLADRRGADYWRALEELAEAPAFAERIEDEFPRLAEVWGAPVDRRTMLKLMGASMGLAGLSACGRFPQETVVPYVAQPERVVPGNTQYFATTLSTDGYGQGVLVASRTGRPTFIAGNPKHPASLGATDPWLQARVLELYDPDRSQSVSKHGQIAGWKQFVALVQEIAPALAQSQGEGLRILTPSLTSPALGAQVHALLARYPKAAWHCHDPVGREQIAEGAELAFGKPLDTHYDLAQAKVLLALDADFMGSQPGRLRYARDFASGRRVRDGQPDMNRLYVIESTPTVTGAAADHRLALPASRVEGVARAVAARLGIPVEARESPAVPGKWLDALARDLSANAGRCVVIPGDQQSAAVHALAQAMNWRLGNFGATVQHTEPLHAPGAARLEGLVQAMEHHQVDVLVVLEGNPVYDAPADLEFAARLKDVPLSIHAGLYRDETARLCQWHINTAHPLESWGDARAFDGTVSLVQPLIAPLYGGKTAIELLALLAGQQGLDACTLVRAHWRQARPGADFETFWDTALRDGVVPGSRPEPQRPALRAGWAASLPPSPDPAPDGLELQFRPDPSVWDGRFANNGWLQELPGPLSKLSWDNAAWIAPTTAERLGLESGDVVEIRQGGRRLRAPIWVQPGQPAGAVTLHLGYGRAHAGQLGNGVGVNAYALRTSASPWCSGGARLFKTGQRHELVTTQRHHSMEGRGFVRSATLARFRQDPHFAGRSRAGEPPPSLYPAYPYKGYQWGMAIDLTACIGCNACIAACQNENNTPIVGRKEVGRGHDMHWLRVDRYYQGDPDAPTAYFEPVPCMQCENAPCEYACPVGATVHSTEGLNDMVYNRCIGTRFCSQNCPYKVRRFNWLDYMGAAAPTPEAVNNPRVTVRDRGVMEKCTYCVQRIDEARIEAGRDNRTLADGDVRTACQVACPTQAIVFGDISDARSEVARLKRSPLNYGLLEALNTRPRTTYLAQVRNPNPELGET